MEKFCILFAGPAGSGKSPIASYLSWKLSLPVFNNDLIRTEVTEDLLKFDQKVYEERKMSRLKELINSGSSFIYDASIDRQWETYKPLLSSAGYKAFIISLDFSKEKLTEIYKAKNYQDFAALDRTFEEHRKFLAKYADEVNLSLKDEQFEDRLESAFAACKEFKAENQT